MRKLLPFALLIAIFCVFTEGADWPTVSGSPQRDGWAKAEKTLSKETVKEVRLLYTAQFDAKPRGLTTLTSPVILGNLIGWRGFKELLFIGGAADTVYAIDADLNKPYFTTHLGTGNFGSSGSLACEGGMTASVAIPGSSTAFSFGGAPAAPAQRASGHVMPRPIRRPPMGPRGPGALYAVGSDGDLYDLRQQDGSARATKPLPFVPPHSKVSSINVYNNVVYATTVNACGGNGNGVYAVDLREPEKRVASFHTNGAGAAGSGGTAIQINGSVYVQIAEGKGDVAGNYHDTVLALDPKDLRVTDYFTPAAAVKSLKPGVESPGVTPLVFQWGGKNIVLASGRNGRLYLLDAAALGGTDHHQPLFASEPVVAADSNYSGNSVWGAFSSWEDPMTNLRWVYAPLRGPANSSLTFPQTNGPAVSGSIVAFTVEEHDGQPALMPQWISGNLLSPAPAAVANGLLFALSTGESARIKKKNGAPYSLKQRERMARPAVLSILDATTGKELFSSGNAAATFSHGSGLAVANGRVYFATHDGKVYCYGVPMIRD
jgi:outer membrane protein assembly factor BamB